jgi:D-xylose reductase
MAKQQLAWWGLTYFDLYLIHFPVSLKYVDPAHRFPPGWHADDGKTVELSNDSLQETWTEMEKLVDDGITKNIGVSNFQGSLLLDLHKFARIKPANLQVELHPYLTQEPLVQLVKALGMSLTAYSSFGPLGWYELEMGKGAQDLLKHDVVTKIASASNKTPAQVLLRWSTQRGIAVVPKSNNEQRLIQNLKCNEGADLSPVDMRALSDLNMNLRLNNPAEIDVRMSIFA